MAKLQKLVVYRVWVLEHVSYIKLHSPRAQGIFQKRRQKDRELGQDSMKINTIGGTHVPQTHLEFAVWNKEAAKNIAVKNEQSLAQPCF